MTGVSQMKNRERGNAVRKDVYGKRERGLWKESLKIEKAYRFKFKSRFRFEFEKIKRKGNNTKSFFFLKF